MPNTMLDAGGAHILMRNPVINGLVFKNRDPNVFKDY